METTTTKRRLLQLLAALLAFAFLAAACGGDDDDDSTDTGDDTSTESTEDTTTESTEDTTTESTDEEMEEESTDDAMEEEGGDDAMAETGNVVTVACGTDSSFASPDAPATDLTVALVAPSASQDLAFTQSMVDSLGALGISADAGNLQVTDGTFVVEEAAAAIRGYAEDGVDVVIAHGTQYGGSLTEIAPDFPETAFLWGTSSDTQGLDNVFAYTPAADQGGYVLGTIAAGMTESGTIGMVGPVEAGDAALYVDGFTVGAEAEEAAVSTTYTGSFGDVQLATEAAQAFVDTGADVLTGTAQHVVGAINVATAEGIPWFGTQANQTSLAPDLVVASQVYHWEVALADIFSQVEGGTLGGEVYEINLENDGLVIEFNGCVDTSDEVKAAAQATVDGIIAGDIDTGV